MRYFFGFLAAIGLIVLVFVLILRGFHSTSAPVNQKQLTDYANTETAMVYTIDGPITDDEHHQGVRISISREQAQIEVYQGYNNNVTSSKTYNNNQAGYTQFLRALDLAGYTKGDSKKNTDSRGQCATGDRYLYQVQDNGRTTQSFWSADCSKGNFQGLANTIDTLFEQQIPDYSDVTDGVNI